MIGKAAALLLLSSVPAMWFYVAQAMPTQVDSSTLLPLGVIAVVFVFIVTIVVKVTSAWTEMGSAVKELKADVEEMKCDMKKISRKMGIRVEDDE